MSDIRLDDHGMAAVEKSAAMRELVKGVADRVAGNVEGLGITVGAFKGAGEIPLPVRVSVTTTDRAHGSVVLAHPAGIAVQAKYGALTKAASEAGLEVKGG